MGRSFPLPGWERVAADGRVRVTPRRQDPLTPAPSPTGGEGSRKTPAPARPRHTSGCRGFAPAYISANCRPNPESRFPPTTTYSVWQNAPSAAPEVIHIKESIWTG
jgi:hypothetical protein